MIDVAQHDFNCSCFAAAKDAYRWHFPWITVLHSINIRDTIAESVLSFFSRLRVREIIFCWLARLTAHDVSDTSSGWKPIFPFSAKARHRNRSVTILLLFGVQYAGVVRYVRTIGLHGCHINISTAFICGAKVSPHETDGSGTQDAFETVRYLAI
jgi:hypothetical protein